jgi:hypothetical protein
MGVFSFIMILICRTDWFGRQDVINEKNEKEVLISAKGLRTFCSFIGIYNKLPMKKTLTLLIFLITFSCNTTTKYKYNINTQNNVVNNFTNSDEILKLSYFALDKLKVPNVTVSIVYIPEFLVKLHQSKTNTHLEAFIVEPSVNTYQILINRNLSGVDLRRVLFHEIIHLKQSHSGRLITCNNVLVMFNGVTYPNINLIPYKNRLWESEAFKHQNTLLSFYNLYE